MARLGKGCLFETKASEISQLFCSQTPLTSLLRRGGLLLSFAVVLFVFDLHRRYSQQAEALISCMRQENCRFVRFGFCRKNHLCYDNDGSQTTQEG